MATDNSNEKKKSLELNFSFRKKKYERGIFRLKSTASNYMKRDPSNPKHHLVIKGITMIIKWKTFGKFVDSREGYAENVSDRFVAVIIWEGFLGRLISPAIITCCMTVRGEVNERQNSAVWLHLHND